MKEDLIQLLETEIEYRSQYKILKGQMQQLMEAAQTHCEWCCEHWEDNFGDTQKIAIETDNGSFLLEKPTKEFYKMDLFYPYGVVFEPIKKL
jgi:hypothetical protein